MLRRRDTLKSILQGRLNRPIKGCISQNMIGAPDVDSGLVHGLLRSHPKVSHERN